MLLSSAVISAEPSFGSEPLGLERSFGQETAPTYPVANDNPRTQEEELQSAFAIAQRELANVAMYLLPEFRTRITRQLRVLLSPDNWEEGDALLQPPSAKSFARAMALLRPHNRPILGLSEAGNVLAMWKDADGQITFEHLPDDRVRWSILSGRGERQDAAAGRTAVERVQGILRGHGLDTLLYG
jgi:hypothetical protein